MKITEKMRVLSAVQNADEALVTVQRSGKGRFRITPQSRLGGAALMSRLQIAQRKSEDGKHSLTVWILQLLNPGDLGRFHEGDEVMFEESD